MSKTTIPTGGITADAIDATLVADDAIRQEHVDAHAFQVTLGSNDTISNDTYTKLDFATEVVDTGSAFASGKFTVPSNENGLYMFTYQIVTDSDSNSNLTSGAAAIYKNGSSVSGSGVESIFSSNPVRYTSLTATAIMSLVATDYIEVYAHIKSEDSSGGRVLSGSSFNGLKLAGA
jgi:hypothetical protein